jgi:hypothetical protein
MENQNKEPFNVDKFKAGMNDLKSPTLWAKDIASLFNRRKIIIYVALVAMVIGLTYAWGWYNAIRNRPPNFEINYDNNVKIEIPKGAAAIEKPKGDSNMYWILDDGSKRIFKAKDSSSFSKKLQPAGFELKPVGVLGVGYGDSGVKLEPGAGVSFVKFYDLRGITFLTERGGYIGLAYKADKILKVTENTYIELSYGKGYKGDTRYHAGVSWKW